jgi:hypothetical protein
MEIIFRPVAPGTNGAGETMCQSKFVPETTADGISATANMRWPSPLHNVCSAIGYNTNVIGRVAKRAKRCQAIATLNSVIPKLFVVPKTQGDSEVEQLSLELLEAVSEAGVKTLHFTHYSYIKDKLPTKEIVQIIHAVKSFGDKGSLQSIIWDIDARYTEEVRLIERYIAANNPAASAAAR